MPVTRRKLLKGGTTATVAAWVARSEPALAAPASANADSQVLERVLEVEQLIVYTYRQVLARPVLRPEVRTQLERMLSQELEHVAAVQRALAQTGASGHEHRLTLRSAQAALTKHGIHWQLADLKTQHDCLKLLVDVESLAENAYFHAIANLQDPRLLRISAGIMGCEAQHWTVISGFLNHNDATKAVPYPFVGGSP